MAAWHSPNDLKNTAKSINEGLEERSAIKGQEAADRLMRATKEYGGLWFFVRFPVSIGVGGIFFGGLLVSLLSLENILLGMLVFAAGTWLWYVQRPLKVHPIFELFLVVPSLAVGFWLFNTIGIPIL